MTKANHLLHGKYNPPEKQLTIMAFWNKLFHLEFSESMFHAAEQSVPEWPMDELSMVTLVPYLGSRDGQSGFARTFDILWKMATRTYAEHHV